MTNTFYMVELDFPHPDERDAFDHYYQTHIDRLLTIDGFMSAQRFECTHKATQPFLAIYQVEEPGVMTGPSYGSKGGRHTVSDDFRERMINWDRNLVQTEKDDTLEVPADGWMIVVDRKTDDAPPLPEGFTHLTPVGLDMAIKGRAIKYGTGDAPAAPEAKPGWVVRTFRPMQARRKPE